MATQINWHFANLNVSNERISQESGDENPRRGVKAAMPSFAGRPWLTIALILLVVLSLTRVALQPSAMDDSRRPACDTSHSATRLKLHDRGPAAAPPTPHDGSAAITSPVGVPGPRLSLRGVGGSFLCTYQRTYAPRTVLP